MSEKKKEEGANQTGVRKRLEEEAARTLEKLGMSVGLANLPVMPPVTGYEPIVIKTNVFKLLQKKEVPILHYTVRCTLHYRRRDGSGSPLVITEAERSDVQYVRFRHSTRILFTLAQQSNPTFIPETGRVFYDGIVDLFSLDPLNQGAEDLHLTLSGEFCRRHIAQLEANIYEVVFDFVQTDRSTVLGEVLRVAAPDIVENQNLRPLIHFLEIATSEKALNNNDELMLRGGICVLKDPVAFGFPPRNPGELHVGGYIAPGCKKTVRAIGSEKTVQFGVVIDPKVAAFHHVAQLFSEKVLNKFPRAENADGVLVKQIDDFLKRLWFLPLHRPENTRPMFVHHIAATNAETTTFERNGQEISVLAYFRERYNITLRYPHLPLVVVKQRGKELHFPMEVCEVCDNQRLAKNLVDMVIQQQLLTASTRAPADLERDVVSNLRALGMTNSEALAKAHIEIAEQPMEVSGHRYEAPAVQYANRTGKLDFIKGSWGTGKYHRPASIKKWALYGFRREGDRGGNNMTFADLNTFHNAFVRFCREKGMQIGDANDGKDFVIPDTKENEHQKIKELMENAAAGGCKFVLYVTGKEDVSIHQTMKHFEQRTGIVTQNVTAAIARQCAGIGESPKRQTFENVVNKTNMKAGGINYVLPVGDAKKNLKEGDLYIGVSSNVSGGGFQGGAKHPTVVGYAANDLKNSIEYSGNYIFQEPLRDEKVNVIMKIVETAVDRFTKSRGGSPKRVFLFRNSSSEGSFDFVMKFEIPLVQRVLKAVGAQLVFVVATRQHNVRLTPAQPPANPNAKNSERNLRAGTCVDTKITNPYIAEFFLLGHVGKLGTAKLPRYDVLCNEPKIEMEDLQRLTFHLCFQHQIINQPTSLPTPVFIASEMAKRGRNVYNVALSRLEAAADDSLDFQPLIATLDYANSPLRNVRFNS
ncbi:Piwi domain protein [Aphelenchoides fujianensis]|nr:Piwi domain protein [Aphelenchoides fujianensis]